MNATITGIFSPAWKREIRKGEEVWTGCLLSARTPTTEYCWPRCWCGTVTRYGSERGCRMAKRLMNTALNIKCPDIKEVSFKVFGKPEGKGRPRFARTAGYVRVYTPECTQAYEDRVKGVFLAEGRGFYADAGEAVEIAVDAFFEIPKGLTKKKRAEAELNMIFPTKKPDWDNIGKIVTDALNGLAWHDDAQIVRATVSKVYTVEEPRVEIYLKKGF